MTIKNLEHKGTQLFIKSGYVTNFSQIMGVNMRSENFQHAILL